LRFSAGSRLRDAICVYDVAQSLGIEVRFVGIPSLEGMYWKKSPATILLGAERPAGRQSFTCAHELGHHIFNHGNKIDGVLMGRPPGVTRIQMNSSQTPSLDIS